MVPILTGDHYSLLEENLIRPKYLAKGASFGNIGYFDIYLNMVLWVTLPRLSWYSDTSLSGL